MEERSNVAAVPAENRRAEPEGSMESVDLLAGHRERLQRDQAGGAGYTQAMIPVVEKVCATREEKAEAYTRHTQLFLTEGRVAAFCVGVSAAMEERLALEKDLDPDSINAVKVALMGRLPESAIPCCTAPCAPSWPASPAP